ncbi:hypothetical protein [Sinorhizobium saheli]|uniref:DUF1772 domain-containing protein n=1 Tax=Sinorhizobium saheli TaxID=36856 RepID=A0A178YIQ9_SINSA|nr:hypothetical protein [Sinorhizobium saheli]MQW89483.1 DUF1772 domain-containing protein [Sinorhizobium saheli]OAP47337.1 hypothetical protein ATB98_22105 [Sinorhizobium saheli]
MVLYLTSLASLLLAALSLGPSYAHVLEAPPRLVVWSPELWRETTVFNGQFALFAKVGGPVDVAAILSASLLAYLLASERPAFWFALGGAVLLAAGLAAWFTLVAPANAILASWRPGPIPPDFEAVRLRWETGHMAVAAAKLLGFAAISAALLAPGESS